MFGPEAYFVNHPSKFLAKQADTKGKTYDAFLMYSANFAFHSKVSTATKTAGWAGLSILCALSALKLAIRICSSFDRPAAGFACPVQIIREQTRQMS